MNIYNELLNKHIVIVKKDAIDDDKHTFTLNGILLHHSEDAVIVEIKGKKRQINKELIIDIAEH